MTADRPPIVIIGWGEVAARSLELQEQGVPGLVAWETAAGIRAGTSESLRKRDPGSLRARIVALLADGKPRTVKGIHQELDTSYWQHVATMCRALTRLGELEVAGTVPSANGGPPAKLYGVARG